MRRSGRPLHWVLALAAVLALLDARPAGAASAAQIQGTVRGLPLAGERAFASVRAVQATSGRIMASKELGGGSSYGLSVKPGLYLIVASAVATDGRSVMRTSRLIVARAGRTARADLVARTLAGPAGSRQETAGGGPVVAIGDIQLSPVEGLAGEEVPVQDAVIGRVLPALQAKGMRLVSRERKVIEALRKEAKLSDEGRMAEKYELRMPKAQFFLVGDGTYDASGTIQLELRVRDRDGFVVAVKTLSGSTDDWDGFIEELRDVTRDLAGEAIPKIEEATGGDPEPPGDEEVDVHVQVRGICACGAIWGTVTASVAQLVSGYDIDYPEAVLSLPIGTTVHIRAEPTPGHYFGGWAASICGWEFPEKLVATPEATFACTVTPKPAHIGPYTQLSITGWADFHKCPPPGTVVAQSPGAAVCPGVIIPPIVTRDGRDGDRAARPGLAAPAWSRPG
ncbi:MAG: hypothetical protein IT201_08795 [Thermoleophilia bacterium]|nr:hypothetical protein [Thermoleophilia bacterium]